MYAAWGLSSGQFTPAQLAAKASTYSFKAVALEWDDFNNASRFQDFVDACRAEDISPGGWVTHGVNIDSIPASADFVIAEIETPDDYDGVIAALPYLGGRPKALVTTFGGLLVHKASGEVDVPATKEHCAPLVEAGFDIQTEFYRSGLLPDATPAGLEFIARSQCGFTGNVAPVFGLFGGYDLHDYAMWQDTPGWGVWLAEFLP